MARALRNMFEHGNHGGARAEVAVDGGLKSFRFNLHAPEGFFIGSIRHALMRQLAQSVFQILDCHGPASAIASGVRHFFYGHHHELIMRGLAVTGIGRLPYAGTR